MHGDSLRSLLKLLESKDKSNFRIDNQLADNELNALIELGKLMHHTFPLRINPKHCLPSGYTYLGQFIDHDLIFSMNGCPVGHDACQPPIGFESKLNLSAVYGDIRNRATFAKLDYIDQLSGQFLDIPKGNLGLQPIPDPRNNENLLISQLHLQFIKLHNKFIDEGLTFKQARDESIAIYCSIVLHDFLKKILYKSVWEVYFGTNNYLNKSDIFYKPFSQHPIPPEFSKAAFRFGHSMIKKEYNINNTPGGKNLIKLKQMLGKHLLSNTLTNHYVVDWELFFGGSDRYHKQPLNRAKAISPAFNLEVDEIGDNHLPATNQPDILNLIAVRNLLRGKVEKLADFNTLAKKTLKFIDERVHLINAPNPDQSSLGDIKNKIDFFINNENWLKPKLKSTSHNTSPAFCDLDSKHQEIITKSPPLWYGILCESHYFKGPNKFRLRTPGLGPVGSIIIAETFSHLLDLQQTLTARNNIKTMVDLLKFLKGA